MINEEARERMRRAYYLEKKTLRQIAREEGYSRVTIKKAISDASPRTYHMTQPRPAIVLGLGLKCGSSVNHLEVSHA